MKKLISIIFAGMLILGGCAAPGTEQTALQSSQFSPASEGSPQPDEQGESGGAAAKNEKPASASLDNIKEKKSRQLVEDMVTTGLKARAESGELEIAVENVNAVYLSREYMEELAYNSEKNRYFSYELSELDKKFKGQKYVFTIDKNGKTIVEPFKENDPTFGDKTMQAAGAAGSMLTHIALTAVSPSGDKLPMIIDMSQPADPDITVDEATDMIADLAIDAVFAVCTKNPAGLIKTAVKYGKRLIWKVVTDYDITNQKAL